MLTPYHYDELANITIYHGDCIEILPQLAEQYKGKIKGCFTDPPYGVAYQTNHRLYDDKLAQPIHNDENLDVVRHAAPLIYDLLAMDTAAYFFASPHKLGENREIFDKLFTYKNTLVWDKGDGGTAGDLEAGYSQNWEAILYYNKGRCKLKTSRPRCIPRKVGQAFTRKLEQIPQDELVSILGYVLHELTQEQFEKIKPLLPYDVLGKVLADPINGNQRDIKRKDWSSRSDPVHATVKPVSLMAWMIENSTNEGDLIIDPFMGSGPTLRAAKQIGQPAIGIELDKSNCSEAVRRLKEEVLVFKPEPVKQAVQSSFLG